MNQHSGQGLALLCSFFILILDISVMIVMLGRKRWGVRGGVIFEIGTR